MARLLRHERKALTRDGLLETARRVFLKRGYHATTLEAVAEAAGFSKGAVYSNFKSKDDLFLTLLDELTGERLAEFAEDWAAAKRAPDPVREFAVRLARRRLRENPGWSLLLMEFWTHAARRPRLRRQFAVRHRALEESVGRRLEEMAAEQGLRLRRAPVDVARAGSVIGHGMALEWIIDPGAASEGQLADMFVLMFRDATAPAGNLRGGPAADSSDRAVPLRPRGRIKEVPK